MKNSALALLQDAELCRIFTDDGEREARWVKSTRMFVFTDLAEPAYARHDQVDEWAPAGVKF